MKRFREVAHIIVVTGILLALTLSTVLWIAAQTRRGEIERAYLTAVYSARVFAEQVERTLRSIDADLRFAAHELARDAVADRLRALVDTGALSMDLLVQIAFVDAAGRTIATHLGPDPNLTDVSDREHIRVHLDGVARGLFVGRPVLGRVSGRWSIQLSRAVARPDGSLIGVLVASLDPLYFERFWSDPALGAGNLVMLLGEDGYMRTRSHDAERILSRQVQRADIVAAAVGQVGRFDIRDADGVRRFAAHARLGEFPLLVVSGLASADVEARVNAQNTLYLLIAGSIAAMLAALGGWLSYLAFRLRVQEEEAGIARRRLSEAVEAVPEGFALFDAQDRLVVFNDAFRRMHGAGGDLVRLGMTYETFCREGVRAGVWRIADDPENWVRAMIDRHRDPRGSFEAQTSDGAWLRMSERRTLEGGIVGIWTDITGDKDREETLIRSRSALAAQADEMRTLADAAMQADRAKSAFLAAMSHEIRTPLNALLGFAKLLARTPLDEEQRDFVKVLEQSAMHLKGVVSDVLEFSQLEADRLIIEPTPFAPREMIDHLRSVLGVLISGKPIEISCVVEDEVPDVLLGDASRIYQVLLNIAGNAAKFTESGTIDITLSYVPRQQDGPIARFVIADTGRGIGAEAMGRLFRPFEQGDAPGALRAAGTGLGLAISAGLVKKMGGVVNVESAPGAGSVFRVDLPLEASKEPPAPPARETLLVADATRPLAVLVADDAPSSRKLVRVLLEKAGHRVREAGDGDEAVRAAAEEAFDLIFLDLQMPMMGGVEAAAAIRRLPAPNNAAALVALTAQAMASDRDAALAGGMDRFIAKPVDAAQLYGLLADVAPGSTVERAPAAAPARSVDREILFAPPDT